MNGRYDVKFNHLDPSIREAYPRAIAKLASRENATREQLLLVKIRMGDIPLTGAMDLDVQTAREAA